MTLAMSVWIASHRVDKVWKNENEELERACSDALQPWMIWLGVRDSFGIARSSRPRLEITIHSLYNGRTTRSDVYSIAAQAAAIVKPKQSASLFPMLAAAPVYVAMPAEVIVAVDTGVLDAEAEEAFADDSFAFAVKK